MVGSLWKLANWVSWIDRAFKKGVVATKRASGLSRPMRSKAASISRLVLALKTWICRPMVRAAGSTSRSVASVVAALAGLEFDSNSAAFAPTKFAQSLHKRGDPFAARGTRALPQETDGRHLAGLLRVRRERPRDRTAQQSDEGAAPHSITSSARCWRIQGTSRPSAFAVLRLITSSNLTGAC